MKENNTVYIRCRTCGKYVEENQSINNIYCSEKCAEAFSRCPNCGKYFPKDSLVRYDGYCSLECKTVYNEDGLIISTEEEISE